MLTGSFLTTLLVSLYFLSPIIFTVFFTVSLVLYIKAKRANKLCEGTYTKPQIKTRLVVLIVSIVCWITGMTVVVGLAVLLLSSLAYM